VAEWLHDPSGHANREDLLERLQLEKNLEVYFQALIVSPDQKILLSVPSSPEMEADSWASVKTAMSVPQPVLSRLHYTPSGKIHVDIAQAVRDSAGQILAVLVLTTNADEYLFPMIKAWPTASRSGEALLVRREGDEVLFLNELRQQEDTALKLRFPLSCLSLPAAQAVLGKTGIFLGKDYRGNDVISDLRPIPTTDWYLVTKEDLSEFQGEVRSRAFVVSVTVLMLILLISGVMTLRYQRLRGEASKHAGELLKDSEMRYRRLFETAQDGILIVDAATGMIVDVNPFLIGMLGYSHAEFLGKSIWEVGCLMDIIANKDNFSKLQKEKYVRYEDLPLETADGGRIEVEFVSNVYQVEHHLVIQCNIRDITRRKRVEEGLRLKNLVFDSSIVANSIATLDGVITEANEKFLKIWGYPDKAGVIGKSIVDFFSFPGECEVVIKALNGEGVWEGDFAAKRKDGSTFTVHSQATIVRDEKGKAIGYQSAVEDITDRRRMEKELAQARDLQFKTLMESLPSKVFLKDRHSVYMACNENYARDLKIKAEQIKGKTDFDFFPTSLAVKQRAADEQVMNSGKTESCEGEYLLIQDFLEGSPKSYVNIVKVPVRDGEGNVTGLLSFFWDITERRRADEEVRESKALIEAVVENAPFMIFLKEAKDLRFVVFNRAGEELLGYDRKMLLGKNNLDLFPPEQAAHFMAKDREVLDGENGILDIPEEYILTAKKGQRVLHTRKICLRGTDGVTKYLLGISEDITEQKKLEAEKNRVKELASVSESKSRFASMVSHELRSPLAVIKEALSIVLEGMVGVVSEGQRDILDTAKRNVDRLGRLINNILDFQKIESGKMEFDMQENDLCEVMEEIHQSLGVLAKRKGLELRVEHGEGLPKIKSDRDKLVQVFTNLVSNAINNTEKGSVSLALTKENEMIHVRVIDTGIGIPPDGMSRLFSPFEQVEGAKSKKKGGTGLGLAISKEIILAHHGKIWAESDLGKGSTFHFLLPAQERRE